MEDLEGVVEILEVEAEGIRVFFFNCNIYDPAALVRFSSEWARIYRYIQRAR